MKPWKRLLLIGVGLGAGAVLGVALIAGGVLWYQSRPTPPKPWNTKALQAIYSGIDTVHNKKLGQSDVLDWLRFFYVVKNNTNVDYQLEAASARLMGKLQQEGSLLHDPDLNAALTIEYPLFIPANQSVRLEVYLAGSDFEESRPEDHNSAEYIEYRRKLLAFLNKRRNNLGGFVLYDTLNRYEIDFPSGWTEKLKKELDSKDKK